MSAALPRIAVTMGDGAGIGPEIIVKALADPHVATMARPVVVGDAVRLEQAADIVGRRRRHRHRRPTSKRRARSRVASTSSTSALLPADLPFGQLSAVAGDAAYHYIRVAAELAMAGKVQAICTAPLNKEALHAGGHVFPGHTELLAHLTGTPEVSMMLSHREGQGHPRDHAHRPASTRSPASSPASSSAIIRRGHEALRRRRQPEPQDRRLRHQPARRRERPVRLRRGGDEDRPRRRGAAAPTASTCTAPCPPTPLFFLAGRGDYDLVVAMYHDQGHGPVKVLGLEAGRQRHRSGCPSSARPSTTAPPSTSPARASPTTARMIEALRLGAEMAPAARRTPKVPSVAKHTAQTRRGEIVRLATTSGLASVEELSDQLGVTASTIRRDLAKLTAQGKLARTYGGVMSLAHHPEASLRQRLGEAHAAKRDIARWAAAQIEPGETVLLDAGSTMGALADAITKRPS